MIAALDLKLLIPSHFDQHLVIIFVLLQPKNALDSIALKVALTFLLTRSLAQSFELSTDLVLLSFLFGLFVVEYSQLIFDVE